MGKKESQAGSLLTGNKAHFVDYELFALVGRFLPSTSSWINN
jgi:hypothetical protein